MQKYPCATISQTILFKMSRMVWWEVKKKDCRDRFRFAFQHCYLQAV